MKTAAAVLLSHISELPDTNPPNAATPSQQKHHKSCKPSFPQNIKLIPIIERILPNGSEAWHNVMIAYIEESDVGIGSISCVRTAKEQLVPQVSLLTKFIAVLKLIVAFSIVGLLGASSGEDDEYLKSSSSSADKASGREDAQSFDSWMAEDAWDNEDAANVPPNVNIPVHSPITTNQHVDTAPTPNDEGNNFQPPTASGITVSNNKTSDHPATSSTSIPYQRPTTASRQSSGSGKSGGKL
jgi:hypothetical protein